MSKQINEKYTGLYFIHTARDWRAFFISTPVPVILYNYFAFGDVYFSTLKIFLLSTFFTFLQAFLVHFILMHLCFFWRRQFPHINQSMKRYLVSIFSYIATTLTITTISMLLYNQYHFFGFTFNTKFYYIALGITSFSNTIMGSVYEFFYTLQKWKDGIEQKEQLDKLKLQSELDILKSQVNPHFLFNSLNSLSSLIGEDPALAEQFVDELSKVYRYLLRNNEEVLTSLSNELKFIHSYAHLLKTRYGSSVQIAINVPDTVSNYQIPPLTLQLLVENAVKHNCAFKDKPLVIEIMADSSAWLVIKNNLQKKTSGIDSSKIGLANIKEKYKLLNQPEVHIKETPAQFIVTIPLISQSAM